jgi:hypothetical protein
VTNKQMQQNIRLENKDDKRIMIIRSSCPNGI